MPDVVGPLNLLVLLLAHEVQAAAHTPQQQAFLTTVASATPHVAPLLDVKFSAPVVVGSSNTTHFYFPSIAVGLPGGELVQHVTLCDDKSTCDTGRCALVLRSSGGVRNLSLIHI